jgi:hypothetical protein
MEVALSVWLTIQEATFLHVGVQVYQEMANNQLMADFKNAFVSLHVAVYWVLS